MSFDCPEYWLACHLHNTIIEFTMLQFHETVILKFILFIPYICVTLRIVLYPWRQWDSGYKACLSSGRPGFEPHRLTPIGWRFAAARGSAERANLFNHVSTFRKPIYFTINKTKTLFPCFTEHVLQDMKLKIKYQIIIVICTPLISFH